MNSVLTSALKSIIVDNGLVDTGALRDSIVVDLSLSGLIVIIDIRCEDYIVYHLERNSILTKFINTPAVGQEISMFIGQFIDAALNDVFSGREVRIFPEDIQLVLNGNSIT